MAMPEIQLIGGGKMGEALATGLVRAQLVPADELRIVEPLPERVAALRDLFPDTEIADTPGEAHGHVVAVKPADVPAACRALPDTAARTPVLSIAAGVTLAQLESWLPEGTPVVRAMPNTPALVGAGAAAVSAGRAADDGHMTWAEQILGAVGIVVRVDESLLDAVTGLSGSGPAYVFLLVEALVEAGVLAGLPRPVSQALTTQTVLGAAKLLDEGDAGPEALRSAVTSPGGTTAAGLRELERAGVRAALLDAVMAATNRSRELGAN